MELKRYILFESSVGWVCHGEPSYTSSHMPTCIYVARQHSEKFAFIIDRHQPQHVIYLDSSNRYMPHEDFSNLHTDDFPLLKELVEKGLIKDLK